MTTLEDRYRRLLALYPAEHRRVFGDEMLAVLLSNAGEGQRRPRLGESADLMWHAVWRRLGAAMRPRGHGHWAMAASVAGVVGSLSLFALHLRSAAGEQMWHLALGGTGWQGPMWGLAFSQLALVALAMFVGMVVLWRRLDRPVRRRAVVILAPSGGMHLLGLPLGFFVAYPAAWVSLSLIVGFIVLCFVALKGWERLMHLVELGRQAERAAGENR